MRSVLNGKYTLKQTIHDSCWKWKTDVLQRRESIWPQAAKTQRPKFRPMNFILVSECTSCTHTGSAPCSMCIAPSLQNLHTALLLADGTEKNPRAQRYCQNGSSLPLLTAKAFWLHQRWASWEEQQDPCVLGTRAQMGREFYRLLRNAHSIFTHIFLALMVKLNIASKKSCSKCFLILFLFNKWEMFPNSGLKNSIFLKKQVVEESLWLLAATVHAQLKNMPAWQRASNQAPGRTHSFPEVTKYSKNL